MDIGPKYNKLEAHFQQSLPYQDDESGRVFDHVLSASPLIPIENVTPVVFEDSEGRIEVDKDGVMTVTSQVPTEWYDRYHKMCDMILLDPDCLAALSYTDIMTLKEIRLTGKNLTKEERGFLFRIDKIYYEEVTPVYTARALSYFANVTGRSNTGLADLAVENFHSQKLDIEVKFLPRNSKFLDLDDLERRNKAITNLAEKLKEDDSTRILFIPMESVSAEDMMMLLNDFDRAGYDRERIRCLPNVILQMAGAGFKEVQGKKGSVRLQQLPYSKEQTTLFHFATRFHAIKSWDPRSAHEDPNDAYYSAIGLKDLIARLEFFKNWPYSELELKVPKA